MVKQKSTNSDVELQTALKIRHIEEQLSGIGQNVEAQFNLDSLKEQYKNALMEADIAGGKNPDEEKIIAATEIYFSKLNTFQEPQRDFKVKLAEAYVERGRLGRRYGIPAVLAMGVAAAVWVGAGIIKSAHQAILEERVEARVENVFKQSNSIDGELEVIAGNKAVYGQLPESEKLKLSDTVKLTDEKLAAVNIFLEEFCPKGSAKTKVTQENYLAVNNTVVGYEKRLEEAKEGLTVAKELVQTQEQFTGTRRSLDSLITEVRNLGSAKVLEAQAEIQYNNGISCLTNRQLTEAKRYNESLLGVKKEIGVFENLRIKVAPVYSDIERIAKEETTRMEAEQIYSDAQQAIVSADVPALKKASEELGEIDMDLNQDYQVRVVSRPGVKSGVDRYSEPGHKFSGWYLVHEAVDTQTGQIVPVRITNSETGKRERVNMWADRVKGNDPDLIEKIQRGYKDSSLLVSVILDKMDNGIIDNNIMGAKKKGYMHYKLNSPEFEGKQITQW